jgi:hypothetical protein
MLIPMHLKSLRIIAVLVVFAFHQSFSSPVIPVSDETRVLKEKAILLYQSVDFGTSEKPEMELFYKGLAGYEQLKKTQKLSSEKEILTLIDFRKSANEKRLWVIDLKTKTLLFHSLVAHGRNSGDEYASKFSNIANSNQSSLGFYVTGNTYSGKHGLSMVLHGAEKNINHLAASRAIVMHGADYVSETYIQKIGRLGRSFGCPAVPMDLYKKIIPVISEGTCLFIFYPDKNYLAQSQLLPAQNF